MTPEAVTPKAAADVDLVLGIETSCDETAAAVVWRGREVWSSTIASQVDLHARFGGVFPEMASRQHVRDIGPVVAEALERADVTLRDVDAIAVTRGPGLAGSLLVGVNFAKGLSLAAGVRLTGVNHLEGHLYSNWLHVNGGVLGRGALAALAAGNSGVERVPAFPHLTLIVSGGHTDLVLVHHHGSYDVLGSTLDDAAGEAFDKVARLLGFGYPGGPLIEACAREGEARVALPVAQLDNPFAFSFSGLKTAVARVHDVPIADVCASFQKAVVDALVRGVRRAVERHQVAEVHIAGGVSANQALADAVRAAVSLPVRVPPLELCTDNAAMIAATGYWRLTTGAGPSDTVGPVTVGLGLDADPGLHL